MREGIAGTSYHLPPVPVVSTAPRGRTPPRSRPFVLMTVAATALFCATNAPAVFYPVLQDRFGLSPFEIAAVYASYPLALIPALILTLSLIHI